MKFFRKLKREFVVFFSKTCIKSAQNEYFGLDLKYPLIYGMGRGYVVPKEVWMGQCLKAFIDCKEGCVIDVGVNVGVYLVKLKALSNDVEYFGFEPNAVCNYYTNELIRMNSFRNARVLPVALSDEMSVQTLYADRLGDKGASIIQETKDSANLEYSSDIVTVRGDAFIEMLDIKNISVIKIDVEGAELFVLNGLLESIKKFRPCFYIEIWTNCSINEDAKITERVSTIYELITSRDYTILALDSDWKLGQIRSVSEMFDQFDPNYVFVPNEFLHAYLDNLRAIPDCEVQVKG